MNLTSRMLRSVLGLRSRPFSTHINDQTGHITRQNFWTALDNFRSQIQAADFVAIDLEMTGVHSVPPSGHTAPNTQEFEQRYQLLKHLAEKFAVFQVGVSLFKRDQARNKFVAHPYNFYVFPRNELSLELPASTFSCEVSSLEFLANHGFDFNMCIHDGISYLSKAQEVEARFQLVLASAVNSLREQQSGCTTPLTRTSDLIFFERLRIELGQWREKVRSGCQDWNPTHSQDELHLTKATCGSSEAFDDTSGIVADLHIVDRIQVEASVVAHSDKVSGSHNLSPRPSLILQLENDHQVQLSQQVLNKHFQDLVLVIKGDSVACPHKKVEIIFTRSREDLVSLKNELEQGRMKALEVQIYEAVGFRHVIDAMVSSGKPIVGHNCALDLAHIYSKFISPLPPTVAEFSSSLLTYFPCIIDTKYLIKAERNIRASWTRRNTSLSTIYSNLCKPRHKNMGSPRIYRGTNQGFSKVEIDIVTGLRRYQDGDVQLLHEAGYDAFMTGSVFAQACHLLHVDVDTLRSLSLGKVEDCGIAEYINFLNFGHMVLDLRTGKEKSDRAGTCSAFEKALEVSL